MRNLFLYAHQSTHSWLLLSTTSATCYLSLPISGSCCYPCPRICHQPLGLLLLYTGWSASCIDSPTRPGSSFCSPAKWGVHKFASVSAYMHGTLNWLPVSQRVEYRIAALVWRCLHGYAPTYLRELCCPVSDVLAHRALRSASSAKLLVPRARTSTCQRRAFSVVGPSIWNGLPLEIRLLPRDTSSTFYRLLKTYLYHRGWTGSASE